MNYSQHMTDVVCSPMKEIYVFADETGDLGYNLVSGSKYFGFGTVILEDSSSSSMWEAFKLRCALETSGIPLVHGFHAQQDKFQIRSQVFNLILQSRPVFDFTFLNKANAIASVNALLGTPAIRYSGTLCNEKVCSTLCPNS